jgi:hypothetical protein
MQVYFLDFGFHQCFGNGTAKAREREKIAEKDKYQ